MILWRDVRRFLRNRYAITRMNYEISRCGSCETNFFVRLCEAHKEAMYDHR